MDARIIDNTQPLVSATHQAYRPDIDGLRAIAVLSVVVFHAFPGLLKGGFIGVDIFFVISGFLISSIIFRSVDAGTFTFTQFYGRRVRRIFPSLCVVLVFSFGFGWFNLFAHEYAQLGKHIAAGAGFISNFALWSEVGYFDRAAETKPLLHLWSLGIEEQYYIIWPLLVYVMAKSKFRLIPFATLAILGASFVANVWEIASDHVASFYSPQTRFWELLVGSILAYGSLHWPTISKPSNWYVVNLTALIGALLLACAFVLIGKDSAFPGWWAVLPTIAAAALIWAGPHSVLNRMLSNPVSVWFGRVSYPLYLWHWPILSFMSITYAEFEPGPERRLVAVALAVVCASATLYFVERPVRSGGSSRSKILGLVTAMIGIGTIGAWTYQSGGFVGSGFRSEDREQFAAYYGDTRGYLEESGYYSYMHVECDFYDYAAWRGGRHTAKPVASIAQHCYVRDPSYRKSVLIWGDSHAAQLHVGLKHNLPSEWQILQVTGSGCPPDIAASRSSEVNWCEQSNWFASQVIAQVKPDVVIVADQFGRSVERETEIVERLTALGTSRIVFAGSTPHWTASLPAIVARRLWENTPRRTFVGLNTVVFEKNEVRKKTFRQTSAKRFVDIMGVLCNADGCLTYLGDDKLSGLTSWDYGHLTPPASDLVARGGLVDAITAPN